MEEILTDIDKLRDVALEQYGYVTTKQALEAGITHASLSMMVRRGRLTRECYGVYSVPQSPYTQYNRYMLAVLWAGAPEAALSHETALDLYEVCDINPSAIHVTVGKKRRISRRTDLGVVVHHQNLTSEQLGWIEGMPAVTLATAIDQCLETVPSYLLRQAIEAGAKKGLLLADEAASFFNRLEERDDA